jgi:hypothetical protein
MQRRQNSWQNGSNGKNLFRRLSLLAPGGSLNVREIQVLIKKKFAGEYRDFFISGEQVELILKNVPDIFPENVKKIEWMYERLNNGQKKAFDEITSKGMRRGNGTLECPIPVIKRVIEIGLSMEKSGGHLPN